MIVCGAPVGSIQFQRQYVNSKVDSSIAQQLDDLRRISLKPNDGHTIYLSDYSLTFLLRTCDPDVKQS